ncbi:formate dehydrogenase subunit alpha [Mameliella sediminis]|uniref:formate dehydrogenase subunit alpha n=1 Tax=Mameliella sediminis TaxID=2836866 RepID=UPI001C43F65D|nr:formate dehydrogenase subunit alpha [Mameliella sediminis]MBV7395818.1 formate dehydrogenase subunit alpha [Mameliella sediminis]MBY6160231.1 formate dehydrogenase subunit alpha [Mameliella alba]MBY6168701.1 formate dehydrogenase subunit alpha [Mameliella alba]MBY6174078.1 formate dehydrogenase subunit alpha [Mameliella alba]
MSETITFNLNGQDVTAEKGMTIWEVANGRGLKIPHLCHKPAPGYRPDGNCRACMVEIEGERTLAASCIREPSEGMVVKTATARAENARKMVMELLVADQPKREESHDKSSHLWDMAEENGIDTSRFPKLEEGRIPLLDDSHVAMSVNLDACIQCGLCVRACREVQVNDVIGMSGRGHDAYPTFDFADPMGASTCVACGECVQACPTGALMPSTVVDENQQGDSKDFDSETESVCPFCGVGCKVSLKVKDGKVKYVEGINGPANEGRLCVKGRFGFDYIHHPHRLTKPLIRREDAPAKGLNVDPGNLMTHFREASWEEAMQAAAGGLAKLRQAHGGQSVAGFGSAKCTNEEAYLFQKLIRQGFKHNNVDHCTRLCHASSVSALIENVGSGAVTATFNEVENADVAIIIGANPLENHPVAATYFKQFAKRGGKLIVMDPRGQGLKRHAYQMVQFRPGADVSLLNAIMHVIVEEGLYDQQYIEAFTENWEAEKEHLKAFTPEAMEPICGISPEVIRDVARTFAGAKAGMIFWGMGVSQHIHGTDNSRCLISLALMTGHVGRPGTGLHPLRGQNNVQGASDAGLIPMFVPDYRSVEDDAVREDIFGVWGRDEDWSNKKGLTVTEIVDQVYAGNIKGMYIQGENPAMSDPDVEHARDAFAKLEHLVVQDIFLTETACFADVILPASALYEKNGTVSNTNRQVQRVRPAVAPPGEAREDWAITVELGQRLGLPWDYTDVSQVFDEMKLVMKSLDNITWDRLKTETVTYPSLSETDPGQAVVFGDGFPRPEGRAKFTPAAVIPPDEAPDETYPMIMTTGRQLEHWHTGSMTRRASVLDAVEPEANCSLHPKTLRRLGVAPGEMIRLTTRRGSIEIMARADRAVSEDMVFVPFAYVEAAANVLTNPAIDPYGKIPEFKFSAVRVEAITQTAAE